MLNIKHDATYYEKRFENLYAQYSKASRECDFELSKVYWTACQSAAYCYGCETGKTQNEAFDLLQTKYWREHSDETI